MEAYFQAEAKKYRHSHLKILLLGMPLLNTLLSAVLTHNYFSIDCYNWWYTLLFTGMNALLCFNIMKYVFGFDGESDSAAITEHVKNIRGKFRKAGLSPIETVWGIGYKWKV